MPEQTPELDDFTRGYIGAALWTTHDEQNEGSYLDARFDIEDFAPETLEKIRLECAEFQTKYMGLLHKAYETHWYKASSAGHDLWLTRNGYGAGFWDRGLTINEEDIGDELTTAAELLKEQDLYVGDDGKLYI